MRERLLSLAHGCILVPTTVPDTYYALDNDLLKKRNISNWIAIKKSKNVHFSLHQIQILLLSLPMENADRAGQVACPLLLPAGIRWQDAK
jgi:hypothetical protein